MKLHTILGANGNIAQIVSNELNLNGIQVRQFSRNPQKENETDDLASGDLLDSLAVNNAVSGAEVVYLLAGIKYSSKIWEEEWPIIMSNTIEACISNNAKLVFFDNMYAYDPDQVGNLTEETPLNPKSRKGQVRKEILEMLWKAVEEKKITALVARAADFYGPNASNSFLNELVIKRMKSGKAPQWLYSGDKKHSFTYIPDAGKATAFLALQEDSWNQSWHLPTDNSYPSGNEITEFLNKELDMNFKLQVMPSWLVFVLGIFMSIMKEIRELKYQSAEDYCFDSSKIEKRYGLKPTPFKEGLKACI
ncbi:NAD-dependent epimerase/dehydratase family protein [Algoriphagus lutimaris]|uniref:NAD-dependent epimerase/dehydratase family protein n=1 Tax=Algoriphagus lutimaris TaxID=613197 RepID=UPI00196AF96E|nr:NAD-dependent epimerase/dehydratase family protein [Algoriphagus lutimaris]MBN3518604.1 NAD-dependent epimerase/dehydratase family protein [Algoriphagus lutimaris]